VRQRLLIGLAVAAGFLALVVVDGIGSGKNPAAPKSTSPAATSVARRVPRCAAGDMTMAIDVRRPPHRQRLGSGVYETQSRRPVATIVLRNISTHLCHARPSFTLRIADRDGRTVGDWNDAGVWFTADYWPGRYRTFSLPSVYRCNTPGPFTADAVVGGYTARRHGLSRSEITCA
jgi:hypothetical protein